MNKIYQEWLENVTADEQQTLKKFTDEEIESIFNTQLSFGTGGVRSKMGIGPSLLNVYTVSQITNGYVKYLKAKYTGQIKIVLGRDSRNNGALYSEVVTTILEQNEIEVLTFEDIIPTPVVSFMIRREHAHGAIILTASHNPKEYNGYKVYNATGAQLNLDEANQLITYVNQQPIDFTPVTEFKAPTKVFSSSEIEDYINVISTNDGEPKNLKIVFTPIHGTTYKLIPQTLKANGYNQVIIVEEQKEPNGDFPTTISANPEEPQAFEYANKYLLASNADIAIATDPDGDRIGIVCNENGVLVPFSGNETGALLINYLIETNQYNTNSIIYKTIVTGDLGATIASDKQIVVEETLTGFKFIGEKIEQEHEKQFLFGYEESYGYLFNSNVRDKDSIQSALQIANMTNYYKNQNITLSEKLEMIKSKFGYYNEQTFAYTCNKHSTILNIMEFARNQTSQLFGYQIESKIDYNSDDTGLPKSDVVKFYFKDMWIVFRPSGTEPKIKFYVSVKGKSKQEAQVQVDALKVNIEKFVNNYENN